MPNHSFSDISPVVYGVRPFAATDTASKTQYAYRLVGILAGRCTLHIGDAPSVCGAGTAAYLMPGDMMSAADASADFDAVEIFFDFFPYRAGLLRSADDTVFEEQFNPLLCSPSAAFNDVDVFSSSHVTHAPEVIALLRAMLRYDPDGAFADIAFRGLLGASLATLVCGVTSRNTGRKARTAADVIAYINSHVDASLSPHTVSAAFGYHVNYLNSLVKAQTGMPLGSYIKTAKIRAADRMLSDGTLTLTQISEKLGYFDYSHFYKAYKSVTGCAPVKTDTLYADPANTIPGTGRQTE